MSSVATARSPWLRTSSTRRRARILRSSGDMWLSLRPDAPGRQDERSRVPPFCAMTPFGELLRQRRLAALTQDALAERAGISAKAVSDLERDPDRTPRLEHDRPAGRRAGSRSGRAGGPPGRGPAAVTRWGRTGPGHPRSDPPAADPADRPGRAGRGRGPAAAAQRHAAADPHRPGRRRQDPAGHRGGRPGGGRLLRTGSCSTEPGAAARPGSRARRHGAAAGRGRPGRDPAGRPAADGAARAADARGAGQLRARAGGPGRRDRAAGSLPGSGRAGDQPDGAAGPGRARVPGRAAGPAGPR